MSVIFLKLILASNSIKITLKIFGTLIILGSIGIYLLGAVNPSDDTAGTLAGFAVFLLFIGVILFIIGKKLPLPAHVCGDCGFIAGTKRELYNHSINCERKKVQVPKTTKTSMQKTKYFQCEYCETLFEKEVEKLNHYLVCKKKNTPSDKPHAKLVTDSDESIDELERKLKDDG